MKISYNWLKDYLDLTIEPNKLAERLSLVGLEVEEVIEERLDFPNVVVGKVLTCEKHPNADKLTLCTVDVGEERLSIICGAPNVAEGQVVPVAKVGAQLPNGFKIRPAKIRGVQSQGMICSEQELNLTEESEGIWVLPENLPVGAPLHTALNFETDYIFDIALTANRPDCLSHIGVAREVGAILKQRIKKPEIVLNEVSPEAQSKIKIRIDCPESCPRYSARYIEEVTVGPSPAWLVRRLESVGMRSINNVVDITNYVMLETGHPLHAFDYDRISDGQIVVRESYEGEKFTTLDDQERELRTGTVLICDAKQPVAIGGIMGGLNSEVTRQTSRILLESAYFKPESIQVNSHFLGLSTEASQRFERGADPNGTQYALDRAAQFMAEICGGKVCRGTVDEYPEPIMPHKIPLKVDQINNLLGTELSAGEISQLLELIELPTSKASVLVPTFRPDLERVADLAEEIARLYGLDNIPAAQRTLMNYRVTPNEFDLFIDQLKEILTGMGLQEVITGSMINSSAWSQVTGKPVYPILNPISKDMDGMRNSLLPSLARVIQYNNNRQIKDLRLFEIGRVFIPRATTDTQPEEYVKLAIVLSGKRDGNRWNSSGEEVDFFDLKGIVESLIDKISLDNWKFIYYSETVAERDEIGIQVREKTVGTVGQLDEKIARYFELEQGVFGAEMFLEPLFENRKIHKKYKEIPRYPAVERDLAFILDETTAAGDLLHLIRRNSGALLRKVEIIDLYRGKQIETGKKSLALRLHFQSPERTLTDSEINPIVEKILAAASKKFAATLRA